MQKTCIFLAASLFVSFGTHCAASNDDANLLTKISKSSCRQDFPFWLSCLKGNYASCQPFRIIVENTSIDGKAYTIGKMVLGIQGYIAPDIYGLSYTYVKREKCTGKAEYTDPSGKESYGTVFNQLGNLQLPERQFLKKVKEWEQHATRNW